MIKRSFFHTPAIATAGSLAILHLKRDNLLPVTLKAEAHDGYAEGAVSNTRFGSFPHSTLIGLEWGSQVRASKVDTGTRGRQGKKAKPEQVGGDAEEADGSVAVGQEAVGAGQKRKSDARDELVSIEAPAKKLKRQPDIETSPAPAVKAAVEAGSGFIHLLQPTPESWTASLDHRTQVVYTSDYSYILQRLRLKPGSTIIEAGAGSGSFTHAAARAVFNGYAQSEHATPPNKKRKLGKVYSYEYHEPRLQTLRQEVTEHGLDGVVQLTHRDVCNDGFLLPPFFDSTEEVSPKAEAILLDLPAPWQALKHLTRHSTPTSPSPLDPELPVQICTFSPCIEQVMATVSHLRKAGWTEIQMVQVQNHRIDVRREQVGLRNEGLHGVNASAATVEESVARLREVEGRMGNWQDAKNSSTNPLAVNGEPNGAEGGEGKKIGPWKRVQSKAARLAKIKEEAESRKVWKEGNLVHRTEPEVKTHTSYLVFAVLPREWTEEDERAAETEWSVDEVMRLKGSS